MADLVVNVFAHFISEYNLHGKVCYVASPLGDIWSSGFPSLLPVTCPCPVQESVVETETGWQMEATGQRLSSFE